MAFNPDVLSAYAEQGDPEKPLPVEDWNPPACGNIDMRIARDGTWFHDGAPILKPALVRLFSRLLRKDDDGYVLVTPAEKVAIAVEDVPFIAVTMSERDGALVFRTNVGDIVTADAEHPLRFESDADGAFIPYIRVRGGLDARLSQGLARDLASRIQTEGDTMGIHSGNSFFTISDPHPVFEP